MSVPRNVFCLGVSLGVLAFIFGIRFTFEFRALSKGVGMLKGGNGGQFNGGEERRRCKSVFVPAIVVS